MAERRRKCRGCPRTMLLSREGFRCLECPHVYCRSCAKSHFGFKKDERIVREREARAFPYVFVDVGRKGIEVRLVVPEPGTRRRPLLVSLDNRRTARLKQFLGARCRAR